MPFKLCLKLCLFSFVVVVEVIFRTAILRDQFFPSHQFVIQEYLLTSAISNLGSYSKNSIVTNFETGHPRGEPTFMYVPTLWDSNALFAGIWLNNSRRVTPSDEQTAINLWLAATTIAFKSGFTGINQIILKHSVTVFKQLYARANNGERILREKLYIDALISLIIIDSLTKGEKDKWAADGKMLELVQKSVSNSPALFRDWVSKTSLEFNKSDFGKPCDGLRVLFAKQTDSSSIRKSKKQTKPKYKAPIFALEDANDDNNEAAGSETGSGDES